MIDGASAAGAARWYLVLLLITLLILPVSVFLRPARVGQAWALARIGALPLVAWLAWLASLAGIPWGLPAAGAGLMLAALLSAAALGRAPRVRRALRRLPRGPAGLLGAEALYLFIFLVVLWIRSWQPDLEGLEKFMNIAFMNAALQAHTLPPQDPWLAGLPVNYYYFGHATAALAARLAATSSDMGYNIMFAHVFAAAGLGIGANVALLALSGRVNRPAAVLVGALAALTIILGGNFHAVIYGVLRPALAAWGLVKGGGYFYPQSSRFIGFDPDTQDKTITEFSGYSITVGDLHAHVLDLPVAVGLLMLASVIPLTRRAGWSALRAGASRRALTLAHGAALALLLAWAGMANSWDVPVYLLVICCVLLAAGGWTVRAALEAGAAGLVLLAGTLAASAMFWLHFHPFGKGVELARHASPLWQLAVLYGNYALVAAASLWLIRAGPTMETSVRRAAGALGGLLLACALLIAIPETIFLKDIYGADYARANTMFKLSYQVYVILPSVAFAAGAIAIARLAAPAIRFGAAAGFLLLCASPLAFVAIVHGAGAARAVHQTGHLDGLGFLKPGDKAAVRFLRAHPPAPGEAMLEASGDSYTYAARLSATTGWPTVIGWHVHEWLWRNDPDLWRVRADEVAGFYQTMDEAARRAFIARYHVRYIVVGDWERQRYAGLDSAGLDRLGTVVLNADGTRIIETGDGGPAKH